MSSTTTNDWLRIRKLIIQLGEMHQWWPTSISKEGEQFLNYVLPKTKSKAATQLATEVCRLEHDKHIGPSRYHLFRLPQRIEEDIFRASKTEKFSTEKSEDQLLNELKELSSGIKVSSASGPLLVGSHIELQDVSVFQSIARHYYEAFKNNYKTYPYLN